MIYIQCSLSFPQSQTSSSPPPPTPLLRYLFGPFSLLSSVPPFLIFPSSSFSYFYTQGFLTVLPYNATKTSGRLFTFTSDGYIRLSANPNLVLDVNGAVASEGARVLVFPKKTPVTQNQQWVVYGRLIYSRLSVCVRGREGRVGRGREERREGDDLTDSVSRTQRTP